MVGRGQGADRGGDAGARRGRGGGCAASAGLPVAGIHMAAGDACRRCCAAGLRADRAGDIAALARAGGRAGPLLSLNRGGTGRRGAAHRARHGRRSVDDGAARNPGLGGMIAPPAGARILLATKPVDFRRGAHSLAALAAEVLGADPFSGAVLVFRSRRADRIKILLWDGSGLVLVWKQLEASAFRWPAIVDGVVRLTPVEFAALNDIAP